MAQLVLPPALKELRRSRTNIIHLWLSESRQCAEKPARRNPTAPQKRRHGQDCRGRRKRGDYQRARVPAEGTRLHDQELEKVQRGSEGQCKYSAKLFGHYRYLHRRCSARFMQGNPDKNCAL